MAQSCAGGVLGSMAEIKGVLFTVGLLLAALSLTASPAFAQIVSAALRARNRGTMESTLRTSNIS